MPLFRDEPALLAAFRRGERAALERVYRAYVATVETIVRRGCHFAHKSAHVAGAPDDEVPDLVQEVFTRAFREPARLAFDGMRDYGPWLRTIARNVLVDHARRRGREVSLDDLADRLESEAAGEEPAWASAAATRVVEEYLARLSPEQRALHEARYERGLPQREAAEALGISRQSLRTRERRLRDGLEQALRDAGLHLDDQEHD